MDKHAKEAVLHQAVLYSRDVLKSLLGKMPVEEESSLLNSYSALSFLYEYGDQLSPGPEGSDVLRALDYVISCDNAYNFNSWGKPEFYEDMKKAYL